MFARIFGELDPLLRTLTAFAFYFAVRGLEAKYTSVHYLVEEIVAVAVGLSVSAFFSTRVWALPSLVIAWEMDGRPLSGSAARLRISDSGARLWVTQAYEVARPSLFALWILRRIDAQGGLRLTLRTTRGVFRITRDAGTVSAVTRLADGFAHDLQLGSDGGTVATLRMEWAPVTPAVPVTCAVKYSKTVLSNRQKWLASLVRMSSTVETVELVP